MKQESFGHLATKFKQNMRGQKSRLIVTTINAQSIKTVLKERKEDQNVKPKFSFKEKSQTF